MLDTTTSPTQVNANTFPNTSIAPYRPNQIPYFYHQNYPQNTSSQQQQQQQQLLFSNQNHLPPPPHPPSHQPHQRY